jgi:hypothetical protein
MNYRINFVRSLKAVLLSAMFAAGLPAMAAPVEQTIKTNLVPRSVFNQPANPTEGRDPFFPYSIRPYQAAVVPSSHASGVDVSTLVMQGFSGSLNHQLVIINNVTFGVGDDAEVSTSQGRVRIHCLEISGNTALIEANGQRHELRYGGKP